MCSSTGLSVCPAFKRTIHAVILAFSPGRGTRSPYALRKEEKHDRNGTPDGMNGKGRSPSCSIRLCAFVQSMCRVSSLHHIPLKVLQCLLLPDEAKGFVKIIFDTLITLIT